MGYLLDLRLAHRRDDRARRPRPGHQDVPVVPGQLAASRQQARRPRIPGQRNLRLGHEREPEYPRPVIADATGPAVHRSIRRAMATPGSRSNDTTSTGTGTGSRHVSRLPGTRIRPPVEVAAGQLDLYRRDVVQILDAGHGVQLRQGGEPGVSFGFGPEMGPATPAAAPNPQAAPTPARTA